MLEDHIKNLVLYDSRPKKKALTYAKTNSRSLIRVIVTRLRNELIP